MLFNLVRYATLRDLTSQPVLEGPPLQTERLMSAKGEAGGEDSKSIQQATRSFGRHHTGPFVNTASHITQANSHHHTLKAAHNVK